MNSQKEIKGAARIVEELDSYIKDLAKIHKATTSPVEINAKIKALPYSERKRRLFTSLILILHGHDTRLNEPRPVTNQDKLPKVKPYTYQPTADN